MFKTIFDETQLTNNFVTMLLHYNQREKLFVSSDNQQPLDGDQCHVGINITLLTAIPIYVTVRLLYPDQVVVPLIFPR